MNPFPTGWLSFLVLDVFAFQRKIPWIGHYGSTQMWDLHEVSWTTGQCQWLMPHWMAMSLRRNDAFERAPLLSAHDFAEIWLPSPPVNEVSNCLSLSHDFVHFLHFPTCCRLFGWFWWKLKNGWVMIQWFMWINEHSLQKWAMAPLKEGLWMALAKGLAPCQHCLWWSAHPVVECL